MSLATLQELMGHKKKETTLKYIHLAKTNLRAEMVETTCISAPIRGFVQKPPTGIHARSVRNFQGSLRHCSVTSASFILSSRTLAFRVLSAALSVTPRDIRVSVTTWRVIAHEEERGY
jgi:hypothetical protein